MKFACFSPDSSSSTNSQISPTHASLVPSALSKQQSPSWHSKFPILAPMIVGPALAVNTSALRLRFEGVEGSTSPSTEAEAERFVTLEGAYSAFS